MEYLIWFAAVLGFSAGTLMGLSRKRVGYPYTWTERHPWTVMTFLWGCALILVVLGFDVKGVI